MSEQLELDPEEREVLVALHDLMQDGLPAVDPGVLPDDIPRERPAVAALAVARICCPMELNGRKRFPDVPQFLLPFLLDKPQDDVNRVIDVLSRHDLLAKGEYGTAELIHIQTNADRRITVWPFGSIRQMGWWVVTDTERQTLNWGRHGTVSLNGAGVQAARAVIRSRGPQVSREDWRPSKGYVGAKTITTDERFAKNGKLVPRTTLADWYKSDEKKGKAPRFEVDPATGEVHYPLDWLLEHRETWNPRD
jgi:hypothetical protein